MADVHPGEVSSARIRQERRAGRAVGDTPGMVLAAVGCDGAALELVAARGKSVTRLRYAPMTPRTTDRACRPLWTCPDGDRRTDGIGCDAFAVGWFQDVERRRSSATTSTGSSVRRPTGRGIGLCAHRHRRLRLVCPFRSSTQTRPAASCTESSAPRRSASPTSRRRACRSLDSPLVPVGSPSGCGVSRGLPTARSSN